MNNDMLMAGAAGIAPALLLMYWTMRNYTYPKVEKPYFDDRNVFGLLAAGMVIGVLVFTLESWFPIEYLPILLMFILLEESLKLMILNLKRFQRRLDTLFYGLALGLGWGSTMAFGAIYSGIVVLEGEVNVIAFMLFAGFALQYVLLQAGTCTTTAVGVVRGYPWEMFGQSVLLHLVYGLLMIPFFTGMEPWGYLTFAAATVLLAAYYGYLHLHLIPSVVKEALSTMGTGSKD